jgi:V8-like Glu-specific endopeptidase
MIITPLKAIFTLAIVFPISFTLSFADDKSIYGNDNHVELFDAAPETAELANSVVSLWHTYQLRYNEASKAFSLRTGKLSDRINLCPNEPFRGQPDGAFCSGSLVGDDLVMTTSHCVSGDNTCDTTSIVFGFAFKESGGAATTEIGREDVYACKAVIAQLISSKPDIMNPAVQSAGPDYALIRLDRKVTGRKPLAINRKQNLKIGDKMMIIGHPLGLPLKIAGDATVRNASLPGYFIADLDAFKGSSGSPVFNAATRLIEGILARGNEDFQTTSAGCKTMAIYQRGENDGEEVTKISVLESLIPETAGASNSAKTTFRDVNADITAPAAQNDLIRRFKADF